MADSAPVLPQNVRKAVSKVTEKIFVHNSSRAINQRHKNFRKGNEYTSSLPLQMALYFNTCYFPIWLISSFVTFRAKYDYLDQLYKIVILSLLIMMAIVEAIRLYLSYIGNLTEKVPELAGSWLLTVLLQCPSIFFLLFNEATTILPIERAMNLVLAILIVCEILIGAVAIQRMANHQAALFHVKQFLKTEDIGNMPGDEIPQPPTTGMHQQFLQRSPSPNRMAAGDSTRQRTSTQPQANS